MASFQGRPHPTDSEGRHDDRYLRESEILALVGEVGGDVTQVASDLSDHESATAAHGATGAVVGTTNAQTLTNKTLTTPTIASFVNSTHDHADAAGGGIIPALTVVQDELALTYPASVIDGLIATKVAAINARVPAVGMGTSRRYSCLTHGLGTRTTPAGATVNAGDFRLQPLYFGHPQDFTGAGINVTTLAAGGLMGLGVYTFDPATWVATLIDDLGEFDCSATGESPISFTENYGPGEFWIGTLPNDTIGVTAVSPARGIYQSGASSIVGALGRSAVSSSPMDMPATVTITAASTVTQVVWLVTA